MQASEDIDYDRLAEITEGMSGAEVSLISREAGLRALSLSLQDSMPTSEAENGNIERGLDSDQEVRISNEHIDYAFKVVQQRGRRDQPSLFNPRSD